MVWTITIAMFLGTVIALLLMFLLFSRREQIRAALRERRIERRIPVTVGMELSSLDEPLIYEQALTENVGRHGARVVTKKRWRRGESVLVRLPPGSARARIAYCVALPADSFAIGFLRCSPAVHDWVISRSEESNDEGLGHLFRK